MNYVDPPHYHLPKTSWRMLGQLKLIAGSNADGTINEWLMNTLSDFSLPSDLVSRLLASIEETTARVLRPDSINGPSACLEIAVLGPAGQTSKGHTWGFFRVEKASTDSQIEGPKGHWIEYYLYLDKKPE